ncbi:MAG: hypothetical protein IKK58_06225 [Clostridia bacterium]|nr:hypothetical protein [Clostridia bacterium]
MRIIYYLTEPTDAEGIILYNNSISYGGQSYNGALRHYISNHESVPSAENLYLPLRPTLSELACAYLIDTVSKSQKLPRAAGMLCDALDALAQRELPFNRESVDTLPIIHEYLLTGIRDEKDAARATDIIFSILRQFMMDMLLFEGMDIATAPVSAKIPAAQPARSEAESMLDLYIKDCENGRELTSKLPMQDGLLEERRVLILNRPTCTCPELFARLCGFSLLICCDDTARVFTLDCSFDAIHCAASSTGILKSADNGIITLISEQSAEQLIQGFSTSECRSCNIVYSAVVDAPRRIMRNMQPSYSYNSMPLGVKISICRGKTVITLTQSPALGSTHYYHAMKYAIDAREKLLNADLSELFGCPITIKSRLCDLFIDLPVDCMGQFYCVSIKSEGCNFALLDDGAICLWDKIPPLNEMREILSRISALELTVLKDPLNASRILKKATDISIKITSGKGFIKDALVGIGADKRAEELCGSAYASAQLLNVRRSRAVIICASAIISLAICAFPYVTGFIAPTLNAIAPTAAVAILLFGGILFLFVKLPSFKARSAKNKPHEAEAAPDSQEK